MADLRYQFLHARGPHGPRAAWLVDDDDFSTCPRRAAAEQLQEQLRLRQQALQEEANLTRDTLLTEVKKQLAGWAATGELTHSNALYLLASRSLPESDPAGFDGRSKVLLVTRLLQGLDRRIQALHVPMTMDELMMEICQQMAESAADGKLVQVGDLHDLAIGLLSKQRETRGLL